MEWRNEEFDLGGVNHLALVCSDMQQTVEFYTQVLGMRLIKTLDLAGTRWRSSGSLTHRIRFPVCPLP
jgi:catechol 2,3-dioxygenase-like lactoylglutathione lyase family enzyme